MPTITQLEYLMAVDQERHFGRAALACHVAQPSLSMQIQKLEDELDTVVFDRSRKPIIPTESGKAIIEQADVILKEHRKLLSLASLGSLEPKGHFRLAVIPTIAPYLIPIFIGSFAGAHPKVKLEIIELKTDEIVKKLERDEIDAGLLITPLGDDRLIERHLFFEPFYAYVSDQHKLNQRKILSESDLDHNDLWLLEEGHCFRGQVLRLCSSKIGSAALANVEFASGNLETVKNLVKKNGGYTLLPELALANLGASDYKNHVKRFRKPVPTREVSLVHSRTFLKETIINAMEAEIIASLPSNLRSLKRSDVEVIEL